MSAGSASLQEDTSVSTGPWSTAAFLSPWRKWGRRMDDTPDVQTVRTVEDAISASPPADALIIVAVRNIVLFPGMIVPIAIERKNSIEAAQRALRDHRQIGIVMQRDAATDDPIAIDLHRVGTVANIVRYITAPDGSHHIVCQGEQRFEAVEYLNGWPFFVARVRHIADPNGLLTSELEARFLDLRQQALEIFQLLRQVPQELVATIEATSAPAALADIITSYMDAKPEEKQDLLETFELTARMAKVSRILAHRIEVLRLSQEIGQQTRASLDERRYRHDGRDQPCAGPCCRSEESRRRSSRPHRSNGFCCRRATKGILRTFRRRFASNSTSSGSKMSMKRKPRRSIRSRTRICPNRGRPRCDCVGGPSSARRPGSMSRMF